MKGKVNFGSHGHPQESKLKSHFKEEMVLLNTTSYENGQCHQLAYGSLPKPKVFGLNLVHGGYLMLTLFYIIAPKQTT